MPDEDDLVLVATFALPSEAEVAASVLASEGIDAIVDRPFVSGVRPDWIFGEDRPGDGVRLLVRREDLATATEKVISRPGARTAVLVVPTNEEKMIALDTMRLAGLGGNAA